MQELDTSGKDIKVGEIKEMRVLGYADDIAMIGTTAKAMTPRLTHFANESLRLADMQVKLKKTFSQEIKTQDPISKATAEEIEKIEVKFAFKCEYVKDGCTQKFKTQKGARIHSSTCAFGYIWHNGEEIRSGEDNRRLRKKSPQNVQSAMAQAPRKRLLAT